MVDLGGGRTQVGGDRPGTVWEDRFGNEVKNPSQVDIVRGYVKRRVIETPTTGRVLSSEERQRRLDAIASGQVPVAGRTSGAGHLTGAAALDAAPAKVRGGTLTLPGWTAAEKADAADALEHYRDIGFADLNRDLRAGVSGSTKGRNTTSTVDKVMEASRLSVPVTVYRGVANADLFRSGGTVTDAAYGSATADLGTARGFAGKSGAVLRLRVPAGVGAVNLSDMPGKGKADEREGELLLQRGLLYRVVGESTENGVRVIDIEITPGPIAPVRASAPARPARPAGPPKLNRNIR